MNLLFTVAVAVAFFFCWAPFHAQRIMAVYGKATKTQNVIFRDVYTMLTYISGVLYFLSTCINPLLYSIMSHKFRDAFKVRTHTPFLSYKITSTALVWFIVFIVL